MKILLVPLVLCSMASAKVRSGPKYEGATFQESHMESIRMNCGGSEYGTSMSACHDSEMLVYTVKIGEAVYTLAAYGTRPHHESLWRQPAGAAVAVWKDGARVHVRTGGKETQYDIIAESAEDASR